MTTHFNYTQLVKKQNIKSKYPKAYYNNLFSKLNFTEEEIIQKVLVNNVYCSGVIKTKTPLYTSSNSLTYYEFVFTNKNPSFEEWQYFYVSTTNLDYIKLKVPTITKIDLTNGTKYIEFLSSTSLIRREATINSINITPYIDNTHPFLPHFKFSGVVVVTPSKFLYQYYDESENLDSIAVNYLSDLEPINFRPDFNLETKESLYEAQDVPPSVFYLKNEERSFEFTGEMNNTFLKNKVLYKYIERINGESYTTFSLYEPFYGNTNLISNSLGKDQVITLQAEGRSRIKYKQSSNLKLTINKS